MPEEPEEAADTTDRALGLGLPRADKRILAHDVVSALRYAIVSEQLPPGTRLREAEIAEEMGTSRAPVREGLRQLEQEGLVETAPHRGAVVVGLPNDEIPPVLAIRALLEAEAAARTSLVLTSSATTELREIIRQMEELDAVPTSLSQLADIHFRFHSCIVDLAGFSFLRRTHESTGHLLRLVSLRRHGDIATGELGIRGRIEEQAASHTRLLDQLLTGDPASSRIAVIKHIYAQQPEALQPALEALVVGETLGAAPSKVMPRTSSSFELGEEDQGNTS